MNSALIQKNPEVVVALIEELIERGGLETALANRSESEVFTLFEFISWKITDYRYQNILIEVLRITLDMYSGVIGGFSQKIDALLFKDVSK